MPGCKLSGADTIYQHLVVEEVLQRRTHIRRLRFYPLNAELLKPDSAVSVLTAPARFEQTGRSQGCLQRSSEWPAITHRGLASRI
jgi:hypothetical protein